ncbi:MAG: 5'/3'-nucleotidase SurE [Anaerolineae bacterium]
MHVLVTNDDGVASPGISALANALAEIGRVTVLAPTHNWSAAGHNKTMHKPLRAEEARLAGGMPALATNGTPSDCVALAVLGLVEAPIDLVVSGINTGANLGEDITYSGTVAGAMEACISGLPAIAVSLACYERGADYGPAATMAAAIARAVAAIGLPDGIFLNVNVPRLPLADLGGIEVTRLGRRVYRDVLIRRLDPGGRPYYWIGGDPPSGEAEVGTDIWAVETGHVSVTPVQMDMTAYQLLDTKQHWVERLQEALGNR